ncbi:MAG: glycosyltransferase [Acidimicrobiales bacterium]|nr:glycosyltransferase [Acidimicrobiales bacterium]
MRVLLCVSAYTPAREYGGPVTKIGLLAPALRDAGVDVEILTANFGEAGASVAPGRAEVDGIPVTYLRRFASRGFVSIAPGSGRAVRAGFDVVHCFGLRDGMVTSAAVAAHRARLPVVLEPMGMAVPRIRSTRVKTAFDRGFRFVVRKSAATIATSSIEERELEALRYPNVVLRPNPVAASSFDNPRSAPIYDLCYVGRLHEKKRLGDIVAALEAHPEWRAIVAGPDQDSSGHRLVAAARSAGVAQRLEVRGWVADVEKSAIIRSSRVFVLPSATENFGNAAAEAIALGTPAVVTDACGVADIVAATGAGAVAPVDTKEVIRAIELVLSTERREVPPNAMQAYAPRAVAAQQRAIYESVLR